MRIILVPVVYALSIGASVAQDDDSPADNLLPYLEKCCLLGQEFARSRSFCDEAKLGAAHRQHIIASDHEGVNNISCTISASFCCEETLEREIHCNQGIHAATMDATCSKQTDLTAKKITPGMNNMDCFNFRSKCAACCNWCRAGLKRESSACEGLPEDVPMHLKEAFSSCCSRFPSKVMTKKCGNNDCGRPNTTCISPMEVCAFDDESCHYRCVDSPMSCQVGFKMDEYGSCQDVDECALRTHSCSSDEVCVNEYGSYRCKSCNC